MQNILLGYADRVRETQNSCSLSIGAAAAQWLGSVPDASLDQLWRAADDLHRIIGLEREQRDDAIREGRMMVCAGELR